MTGNTIQVTPQNTINDASKSTSNGASIAVGSENSENPYQLLQNDNPSSVVIDLSLSGLNYITWSRAFTLAISVKNKIGFLDGSIPTPDLSDPLYHAWLRCNNLFLTWLLNSVSREIVASILYINSAKEVWDTLKLRPGHSKTSCYRLIGFPRDFKFTKSKPGENKAKAPAATPNPVFANNVNAQVPTVQTTIVPGNPIDSRQLGLTPTQFQRLIAYLSKDVPSSSQSTSPADRGDSKADAHSSNMAGISSNTSLKFSAHPWILDTGASHHMICDICYFTAPPQSVNYFVDLSNGSLVQVSHKGIVQLSNSLVLKNVLCIPSFKVNLISVVN